jgi:hypothetical protein
MSYRGNRNGMSLGQYVGPTWPRGEPGIRVRILLNRLDAAVGRREAEVARLLEVRKRR